MAPLPSLTDCLLKVPASDGTPSPTLSDNTLVDAGLHLYQRRLGDSELSYYLPSRENGVNDMYVPPISLVPY